MKTLSIKAKVVIATVACLALGGVCILALLNFSYRRSVALVTSNSLAQARTTFEAMEATDVGKMSAAAELVMANPQLRDLFANRDRSALIEATLPVFARLKASYGVTILNYIDPEERRYVTMTTPYDTKLVGVKADRFNVREAARTQTWSNGLALGFFGFALRVTHPFYDTGRLKGDKLLGYLELGSEIGGFLGALKKQTGHEYGLLIRKQYLKPNEWEGQRKLLGLKNNWEDQKDLVLANNTTNNESIFGFNGDIAELPDAGVVLGVHPAGDGVFYARSAFPIRDAAGAKVGAMFVLVNISTMYAELQAMRVYAIAFVAGLMILISGLLVVSLSRLVFQRLAGITRVATRLAGGDYDTPISITGQDEIGRFETLFEQLRTVFVDLMQTHERLQKAAERGFPESGSSESARPSAEGNASVQPCSARSLR